MIKKNEGNKPLLRKIMDYCSKIINIDYQTQKSNELQEQILKRLEYQNRQLELTNNILLQMAQAENKEELRAMIKVMMARGY